MQRNHRVFTGLASALALGTALSTWATEPTPAIENSRVTAPTVHATAAPAVTASDIASSLELKLPDAPPHSTDTAPPVPLDTHLHSIEEVALDDANVRTLSSDAPADAHASRGVTGSVSFSVGSHGTRETSASVTVPMFDDTMTLQLSGSKGQGWPSGGYGYGRNSYFGPSDGFTRWHGSDRSSLQFDMHWAPDGGAAANQGAAAIDTRPLWRSR